MKKGRQDRIAETLTEGTEGEYKWFRSISLVNN